MGGQAWSGDAFQNLRTTRATQTTQQIFTSSQLDPLLDPKGVKFRESRDSDTHPHTRAIKVVADVTGSMGIIPEILIRHKFGTLMETLIAHGVPDAQVMFAAVGDHYSDTTPLQVGQFESGTAELNTCLSKIYLEGNGGGQNKESYSLAWLFAGRHTSIDCFEKRGEKGFLFTIGDEGYHPILEVDALKKILGYELGENVSSEQLLKEAERMYHVFHLNIRHGQQDRGVEDQWRTLLGERLINVDDYNNVAEIIATTVAVTCGADITKIVSGFDDATAKAVTTALVKVSGDIVKHSEGIMNL